MDGNGCKDWPMGLGLQDKIHHLMVLDDKEHPLPNQYMQSYENISGYGGKHTTQINDRSVPALFQSNYFSPQNSELNQYQVPQPTRSSLPLPPRYPHEVDGASLRYQHSTINPQELSLLHTSWEVPSMTSSMTSSTSSDMPALTSASSTSGSSHNYEKVPPHKYLHPSKSKPCRLPSSRSSSSFSDSPIKQRKSNAGKTGSGTAQPRQAMAQFEEALKSRYPKLSKGFQQQSQLLFAQFKLLMEKEIEDGNLDAEFDEMSLTASSTQDSSISPEVLDSRYPTGAGSSVPSTPRPQNLDTQDAILMDAESGERIRYYCTFPICKVPQKDCKYVHKKCQCPVKRERYWSDSKVDIKRHEEGEKHWPQETYICLQCFVTDEFGDSMCSLCFMPLPDDSRAHYLQCERARANTKTFGRKDHLLGHLQKQHGLRDMGELTKTWSLPVDSNWPRQCGFCGLIFDSWDERMMHVAWHFEKGFKIQDWKLPFLGPKDAKPPGPFSNYRKDEDDDDDDDGSGGGNSRGKAFRYGTSIVVPHATRHGYPSPSQEYSPYFEQSYQQQDYKLGALNSIHHQEESMRIFSAKTLEWIHAKGQLDTGTDVNWISRDVAEHLGLGVEVVPTKIYRMSTGATLRSSTIMRGVIWSTGGKIKTFAADFRIVPHNAPFEVIFGAVATSTKRVVNPTLAGYRSTQDGGNCRPITLQLCGALGRSKKPSLALERYLNDSGDRVPGLSALPLAMNRELKQAKPQGPSVFATTYLKQGKAVVLLQGFLGGGKSFQVQRYIYEHWNDLDRGVFWVNSKVQRDIKDSVWDIALRTILQYPENTPIVTRFFQAWWQNTPHSLCGLSHSVSWQHIQLDQLNLSYGLARVFSTLVSLDLLWMKALADMARTMHSPMSCDQSSTTKVKSLDEDFGRSKTPTGDGIQSWADLDLILIQSHTGKHMCHVNSQYKALVEELDKIVLGELSASLLSKNVRRTVGRFTLASSYLYLLCSTSGLESVHIQMLKEHLRARQEGSQQSQSQASLHTHLQYPVLCCLLQLLEEQHQAMHSTDIGVRSSSYATEAYAAAVILSYEMKRLKECLRKHEFPCVNHANHCLWDEQAKPCKHHENAVPAKKEMEGHYNTYYDSPPDPLPQGSCEAPSETKHECKPKQRKLHRHGWKQIRSKTEDVKQVPLLDLNISGKVSSYQSQEMKRRRRECHAQSPFIHNFNHAQFRHMQKQYNFGSYLQSLTSYHGSPLQRSDILNGLAQQQPRLSQVIQGRKSSNTRNLLAPKTPMISDILKGASMPTKLNSQRVGNVHAIQKQTREVKRRRRKESYNSARPDILDDALHWTRNLMWILHVKLEVLNEFAHLVADLAGTSSCEQADQEKPERLQIARSLLQEAFGNRDSTFVIDDPGSVVNSQQLTMESYGKLISTVDEDDKFLDPNFWCHPNFFLSHILDNLNLKNKNVLGKMASRCQDKEASAAHWQLVEKGQDICSLNYSYNVLNGYSGDVTFSILLQGSMDFESGVVPNDANKDQAAQLDSPVYDQRLDKFGRAKGNEVVIAVMGVTGSGKSTFIQGLVYDRSNLQISSLERQGSATTTRTYLLVDTPGFSDFREKENAKVTRSMGPCWLCHLKNASVSYYPHLVSSKFAS